MTTRPPSHVCGRDLRLSDRMLAAYRLYCEGRSKADIARDYGVSSTTVAGWIERAHSAAIVARSRGPGRP